MDKSKPKKMKKTLQINIKNLIFFVFIVTLIMNHDKRIGYACIRKQCMCQHQENNFIINFQLFMLIKEGAQDDGVKINTQHIYQNMKLDNFLHNNFW